MKQMWKAVVIILFFTGQTWAGEIVAEDSVIDEMYSEAKCKDTAADFVSFVFTTYGPIVRSVHTRCVKIKNEERA